MNNYLWNYKFCRNIFMVLLENSTKRTVVHKTGFNIIRVFFRYLGLKHKYNKIRLMIILYHPLYDILILNACCHKKNLITLALYKFVFNTNIIEPHINIYRLKRY